MGIGALSAGKFVSCSSLRLVARSQHRDTSADGDTYHGLMSGKSLIYIQSLELHTSAIISSTPYLGAFTSAGSRSSFGGSD